MGLLDLFNGRRKEKSNEVVVKSNFITENQFDVHPDVKDLLWFENGPYKNYKNEQAESNQVDIGGIKVKFSFPGMEEPSLINTKMIIRQTGDNSKVDRPPYYPTYAELTPEQRGVYTKVLLNPYDTSIDIGFVFIFYYGIERHLLLGNFEKAFETAIKLRDVHLNKSFQSYSGNALVLSCLYHQRPDLMIKFIKSLDKEHEMNFSDNLFLLSAFSFDLPLYPKEIMRMSKSFEFDNKNYINKYPEMFEDSMLKILKNKYSKDFVLVRDFINASELKKIKIENMTLFANTSLSHQKIPVPRIVDSFKLKKALYNVLEETHEKVKLDLAEMRKKGTIAKLIIK